MHGWSLALEPLGYLSGVSHELVEGAKTGAHLDMCPFRGQELLIGQLGPGSRMAAGQLGDHQPPSLGARRGRVRSLPSGSRM